MLIYASVAPSPPTHLHQLQSASRFYGRIARSGAAAATAAAVGYILGTNRAHGNLVELQIVVCVCGHQQQSAAAASANADVARRRMIRFAVANVDLNACGCGRRGRGRGAGGRGGDRGHRIHLLLLLLLPCTLHGELHLLLFLFLLMLLFLFLLLLSWCASCSSRALLTIWHIVSHLKGERLINPNVYGAGRGCIVGFNTMLCSDAVMGFGGGVNTCGVSLRLRLPYPQRNEKGA